MLNKYNPKVSIIIPVYNGANFLREAIDSALSQTYNNLEIIVVNDGSCDNGETEAVARKYGDKIKYYSKKNGGVSSALNFGIEKMTGEWFSWLSHDDLYLPQKIEHSLEILKSNDKASEKTIVYTDGIFIKETGEKIKSFRKYFDEGKLYSGVEAAIIMAKKGTLYGCNLLIHRKAFYDIGFFNESLRYSQDSLMWYLLFMNGYDICFCNHKDVLARMHRKQMTNTRKDLFRHDAMIISKILAPLFENGSSTLYYNYIKRMTGLPCGEAIDYLYNYARNKKILTFFQLMNVQLCRRLGILKYKTKHLVKRIIMR